MDSKENKSDEDHSKDKIYTNKIFIPFNSMQDLENWQQEQAQIHQNNEMVLEIQSEHPSRDGNNAITRKKISLIDIFYRFKKEKKRLSQNRTVKYPLKKQIFGIKSQLSDKMNLYRIKCKEIQFEGKPSCSLYV